MSQKISAMATIFRKMKLLVGNIEKMFSLVGLMDYVGIDIMDHACHHFVATRDNLKSIRRRIVHFDGVMRLRLQVQEL